MGEQEQIGNSRAVLLMIAGIPVTVILTVSWLWYFVVQGDLDVVGMLGTANNGSLVQPPRQLDVADLRELTGSAFLNSELERRWAFVIPGGASCDSDCEETLYLTRQIHVAMDADSSRIRRLYISESSPAAVSLDVERLSDGRPAPPDFEQYLASEHRAMKVVNIMPSDKGKLFAEFEADPTTWYLVDPAGWIMMSYTDKISYKDVIADLKFLLKNSRE